MNGQSSNNLNNSQQSMSTQNMLNNGAQYAAQLHAQQQEYHRQNMDQNLLQMQHMQQQNIQGQGQMGASEERQMRDNEKQIYTYTSDWIIYALGFSWRESPNFRLAIGSLKEDLSNEIRIVKLNESSDQDFLASASFEHQFPATKLLWIPSTNTSHPDILATTSDHLKIWEVNESSSRVELKSELKDTSQQFSAPLTSFDWNKSDPTIVGVCSLDTT